MQSRNAHSEKPRAQPGAISLLRACRVLAGLSQAELAEQAGLTRETVGAIERGTTRPHRTTMRALAGALNVELGVLFRDDS